VLAGWALPSRCLCGCRGGWLELVRKTRPGLARPWLGAAQQSYLRRKGSTAPTTNAVTRYTTSPTGRDGTGRDGTGGGQGWRLASSSAGELGRRSRRKGTSALPRLVLP
jgi:hypothetical protein